jgi:large subunit ribosomal protein L6
MKVDFKEEIKIPEGIGVEIVDGLVKVKSEKGELEREFQHPRISIKKEDNKIIISAKNGSKREKTMLYTFKAHIHNLIRGVKEGFTYKLKICSSHFPMSVNVEGNQVIIKNFLGERAPRKAKIIEGVKVEVSDDVISVHGIDKEKTGQTAVRIERATRIKKRDKRIFQDGIYITEKPSREIK